MQSDSKNRILRSALFIAILIIGLAFRLRAYFANHSLWLDEAYLALSITRLSFNELMGTLPNNQAAPLGFLALERLSVNLFGNSELALRLVPVTAGLLSLPLFFILARKFLSLNYALACFFLFAVSSALVRYSAELKPYSSDVLIAIILLLATVHAIQKNFEPRPQLVFGCCASLAVWFSYPAMFVAASCSLVLIYQYKMSGKQQFVYLAGAVGCWVISFATMYFINIKGHMGNLSLEKEWELWGAFPTLNIFNMRNIKLDGNLLRNNMKYIPLSFNAFVLPGLLLLLGAAGLVRLRGYKPLILILPILMAFLASLLKKYPFSGRMLLFAVPMFYIIIIYGLQFISESLAASRRYLPALLSIVLLLEPALISWGHFVKPAGLSGIKKILPYVKQNKQEDDRMFLYYYSEFVYDYYKSVSNQYDLDDLHPIYGEAFGDVYFKMLQVHRENKKASYDYMYQFYQSYIQKLTGLKRVWILVSVCQEEKAFMDALESMGKQIDKKIIDNDSVYLYDFSKISPLK